MHGRAIPGFLVICTCFSFAVAANAQRQGCPRCPEGSVYVSEDASTCFCRCNSAAGYHNQGGRCVLGTPPAAGPSGPAADTPGVTWIRVPQLVSGMSCSQLRGTSLSTASAVYWKLVDTATFAIPGQKGTDAAGITCSCKWRASYQLTSTLCRRDVQEAARINGVRRTRTITIKDTISQREAVLAPNRITPGYMTGLVRGGSDCACDPPAGGQVDQ
jgi:hypothetical protein